MLSRVPRWLIIALIVLAIAAIVTGIVFMIRAGGGWTLAGWIVAGVLAALLVLVIVASAPQLLSLYRLYKFQKSFKEHEAQLSMLPSLLQSGRTQEAMVRFDAAMKDAPDNAYLLFIKAQFLQAAGKLPDALAAANKARTLIGKDPSLQPMLEQSGGQMGLPTTVAGFTTQLDELRSSLGPRVSQMRERREKAVSKRKKKSR